MNKSHKLIRKSLLLCHSLTQDYELCLLYIPLSYYSNVKAYSCTHHKTKVHKHLAVAGVGMLCKLYEGSTNYYDKYLRNMGTMHILCVADIRLFCCWIIPPHPRAMAVLQYANFFVLPDLSTD
jgi:hypothetical protein